MNVEETVIEKLRTLSPEEKQRVLEFVESLVRNDEPSRPRRSLKGLWSDLGISITDEDIAEARREMWGNFPREDI